MDITLTNGNASTVYITKLQARATVTSSLDDTQITASDSASETAFGKRIHDSIAPFVPNSEEGFQWCQYNLVRFKDPLQILSHFVDSNKTHTVVYALSPVSSIGKFWVMGVSLLEDETYIGY